MEDIIKELSIKYNKDQRVIKTICDYPLLFVKHRMEDPIDTRAIMIRHFGKFVFKSWFDPELKKVHVQKYLDKKSIALHK
jgi:hypothetical protein